VQRLSYEFDKEGQMTFAIRLLVAACVLRATVAPAQEVFQAGREVTLPTVVSEVKPEYTPEAKRAHIEGGVIMDAVVLANGKVGNVTVARSLDSTFGLDQQAVKAAKQWTFKPGTKDGKPVAVRVQIEMTFTLK
jgi:protein TonB